MTDHARHPTSVRRLALRCDGGHRRGAGHVARCLPLAEAFADRGWECVFVGRYDGLAAALLERSAVRVTDPSAGPAGLQPHGGWTAAVIDSYDIPRDEICAAAAALPVATLGEARRCPDRGIVLDYHLDTLPGRTGARWVTGPEYAPLDPRLAGVRRTREPVRRILVTLGGSNAAAPLAAVLVPEVRRAFPDAQILLASPVPVATDERVERLTGHASLVGVLGQVELAVSAAGLTAYELACAGVPSLLLAIAENQRRVARGCAAHRIAVTLDAVDALDVPSLRHALRKLREPELRAELAARGPKVFDGHGAARAASALEERWAAAPSTPGTIPRP